MISPSPNGHKYQSMVVPCETDLTIVEVDVEYSEVVYIPELPDLSIEVIVKNAQEQKPARRIMGIEIPHHPTVKTSGW